MIRKITGYTVLLLLLFSSGLLYGFVSAQGEADDWSDPLNLSNSGIATAPLVISSAAEEHVFWEDRFAGWMYARGRGDAWTEPVPVVLPFSDPSFTSPVNAQFSALLRPLLGLDDAGRLHGFWLNERQLLYSSALMGELEDPAAWSTPQVISDSATAVAASFAGDGLHVVYVRPLATADSPTGLYYQVWRDGVWVAPSLVYQSDHLRASIEQPVNLAIALTDDGGIFVAWDNRLLELVLLTSSQDGGSSWAEPTVLDGRKPGEDPQAVSPRNVQLVNDRAVLHLSWISSLDGGRCAVYHQWSGDNGRSWSTPSPIFDDRQGCPTGDYFVAGYSDLLLKFLTIRDEAYLLAWDGGRWSLPELQPGLLTFNHPQTFRSVSLGCLQATAVPGGQLAVFGCGTGSITDIWLRGRAGIEIASGWSFADESAWSQPTLALELATRPQSPALLSNGRYLHLVWGQERGETAVAPSPINYSRWNGTTWSRPIALPGSSSGLAAEPALASDNARERLLVAWRDEQLGELYFSQANAAQANSLAEWNTAIALPKPENAAANSPAIFVDDSGIYYVAFVVAFNEERGVYLTQSADQGASWSEPVKIFDASAANWEMVGPLTLAGGEDGTLHMLWSESTLPPNARPLGLHYARSEDGGLTWSEAEAMDNSAADWSQLLAVHGVVHRFWQDQAGSGAVWHQWSADNGRLWEPPVRVSPLGVSVERSAIVADTVGRLHQIHIQRDLMGQVSLQHLLWQEERWHTSDNLRLQSNIPVYSAELLTAILSQEEQNHQLVAVYLDSVHVTGQTQNEPKTQFLFAQRPIDIPEEILPLPTSLPLPTVTPQVVVTPMPKVTPIPTKISFSSETDSAYFQLGPFDNRSQEGILALSIIPAGIVVLLIFGLAIYVIRLRD